MTSIEQQIKDAVQDLIRQLQRKRDFHRERFMRFYLETIHNGWIPLKEGKAMRVCEETWRWDTK